MWTIRLPLKVRVSKTKDFTLNLNYYRNAHFRTLNNAKVEFGLLVAPRLKDISPMEFCELRYVYYSANKRRADVSNICSVVDKFFCDVLVKAGKIPDDDCVHLNKVTYEFGGVDPKNPRVDVIITPKENMNTPKSEENEMQITLVQSEIEVALKQYVHQIIKLDDNQDLSVELTASRGSNGFTATFDIVKNEDAPKVVATPVIEAPKEVAHNTEPKAVDSTAAADVEAKAATNEQESAKPTSLFANLSKPTNS